MLAVATTPQMAILSVPQRFERVAADVELVPIQPDGPGVTDTEESAHRRRFLEPAANNSNRLVGWKHIRAGVNRRVVSSDSLGLWDHGAGFVNLDGQRVVASETG